MAAADVKMEKPVLVRSLKSSILRSTSFWEDKTIWEVVSAVEKQSRCKSNAVTQRDGKFFLTSCNIIQVNVDVLVSVRPGLLVVEPQRMHEFVDGRAKVV